MASFVQYHTWGLSTEIKSPGINTGDLWDEVDTGVTYFWDGMVWRTRSAGQEATGVFPLDENLLPVLRDDQVDFEWKRQLLDELRAIRLGMELLLEMGQPTVDLSRITLIEEARNLRLSASDGEISEQEL